MLVLETLPVFLSYRLGQKIELQTSVHVFTNYQWILHHGMCYMVL